jgi:hypothetical protein
MEYYEKLKSPKWQKKRLEILKRDDWTCQNCLDKESTLHVHHKVYSEGDPWDINNAHLITLCESCHKFETNEIKDSIKEIQNTLKIIFSSESICMIDDGLTRMENIAPEELLAGAVHTALTNSGIMNQLIGMYLDLNKIHPEYHERLTKKLEIFNNKKD